MAAPKPRRIRKDGEPDRRGALPGQFGQAEHEPTGERRAMVKAFVAAGMPHESIGQQFEPPISADTLTRHYQAELDHGAAEANAKVAGVMFRMATDVKHKDVQRAGQFWLQSRAGWRTRDQLVHSFGTDEGQPDVDAVQPSKITVEFISAKAKSLPGGDS
jgi:hypothetical protein